MDTSTLKKFAQSARRSLLEQVAARMTQVLAASSGARREQPKAVEALEKEIRQTDKAQVIERVAYTWFNRFCALRFMDANRYTKIGIVSPAEGQVQPELLADAKLGHMDSDLVNPRAQEQITALLAGKAPSRDPQAEAYRLLLVAACNYYAKSMPFLFEQIHDYTELLLPDDLLSATSILTQTRAAMTPDACQDVEVIGWLYQFYISEKKDEVILGIKKNKKVTRENIPAATQLFTPHWIVRYVVENSLGRLWMLNRPGSRLLEKMPYYIAQKDGEGREGDFLRVNSPEELKICDPACGSGHMLVYAFDLLYAIYEEEGYATAEIPSKILSHNLFGMEIDARAGELAAFALAMKARHYDRRFFARKSAENQPIAPQICVFKNITFSRDELDQYMAAVGRDLFSLPLQETLQQFAEAEHFGSLIRPIVTDVAGMQARLQNSNVANHLFLSQTHEKVRQVLTQTDYLSPKYHVVIANPPYMGGKGMNDDLKDFLSQYYSDFKSDLFSAFIIRNIELVASSGFIGLMVPLPWMFLSSYEKLRTSILEQTTLTSLVRPEYNSFWSSAHVPICAFTLFTKPIPKYQGAFIHLQDFYGADLQASKALEAIQNPDCGWFYRASAADFKKIPGSPIAYWVSERIRDSFQNLRTLGDIAQPRQGLATTDNNRFCRFWFEIPSQEIGFGYESREHASATGLKWFPLNKGGGFRKWYGNNMDIVNWWQDGREIKQSIITKYPYLNGNPDFVAKNSSSYFRPGITWGAITSSKFSIRWDESGFIPSNAGMKVYVDDRQTRILLLSLLNSCVVEVFLKSLSETLNFDQGLITRVPVIKTDTSQILPIPTEKLIEKARSDWDSYEISWDFTSLPLLAADYRQPTLGATYTHLRTHWQEMTLEVQRLEEKNNRIFIDAYGLQDELTPDVPLNEITLTCNPHYRYGGDKSPAELEALLLADTLKEFISYAVGCMFGRYSLDKPGLILANQGETIADYLRQIPNPTFAADEDNAIPMLDGDWFPDDITERFRKFLRVTFGEAHYAENLAFIEQALGKEIRKYFLRDFYSDHLRRYKKRPIYWLFSSPQGSFNVLIYLHRYRPDTVSVVLNDYLREFRTKLAARKSHLEAVSISSSESQSTKTRALKEIESLKKVIDELEGYEREVLYPLATHQLAIELDDGVKVNYLKFGSALKKIAGLEAAEE